MRKALPLALLLAGCGPSKPPEPLIALPEFSMTAVGAGAERTFTRGDLLGHVWLVDFVFTRCGGPCPLMTHHFSELQGKLPPETRLLSITVDPDYDTPARLRKYAETFGADLRRWTFLRGSNADTYRLLFAGFRMPMSVDPKAPPETRVQHSTRFVLVDRRAGVRRFYDGLSADEDEAILRDVKKLLKERP